jgi:hypothetical protein
MGNKSRKMKGCMAVGIAESVVAVVAVAAVGIAKSVVAVVMAVTRT